MAPTLLILYGTLALCAGFLGWVVVRYDLHQREPLRLMMVATGLGALGMYLAGQAQLAAIAWMHGRGHLITNAELAAMASVSEELAKFAVVVLMALGARRHFDEPIDGLVYGAFAGLGAALEESVAVLAMDGVIGFLPAAEPVRLTGHLVMGGIGGFGVGFVVLRSRLAGLWIGMSLLGAMLLHGLWDVVAFDAFDSYHAGGGVTPAHSAGAIALMLGGMAIFRGMVGVGTRAGRGREIPVRAGPPNPGETRKPGGIWLWVFPVLLWAMAALWLGGDLGKLADDWSQHQRDPATGVWSWPPFELSAAFWRPLHLVLVESLQTLLWRHDRINHAISAVSHGLCVLLLYRVLREAGRSRRAACAAAMLFAVYPAAWEVVFWPAALSTGVATSLLLVMAWLVCRAARTGRGALAYGALPVLGFLLCCFNEQPGGVTPAFALLALACAGQPRWSRPALTRAASLAAASVLGCAVYAGLYLRSAADGARGTAESLVPLDQLGARLESLLPLIGRRMGLVDLAPGALELGVEQLGGHGVEAFVLSAAAIGIAGWFWWRRWMRDPDAPPSPGPGRAILLIAFGLSGAVLAWVPLVMIARYGAPSRAAYVPGVCLAVALATAMDAGAAFAAARGRAGRLARGVVGASVIAAALLGAVMMVGVQGLLRARSRLDIAQGVALRAALPDPPPGTVFLPLSMRDRPVETSSPLFDQAAIGAFRLDWSGPPLVRSVFGRGDLTAGACWHQHTRGVMLADDLGVVLRQPLGSTVGIGQGRYRLGWDRVVPVEIDEQGRVRPISRLLVVRAGAPPLVIEPPLTAAAVADGRCEAHEFRFQAWGEP